MTVRRLATVARAMLRPRASRTMAARAIRPPLMIPPMAARETPRLLASLVTAVRETPRLPASLATAVRPILPPPADPVTVAQATHRAALPKAAPAMVARRRTVTAGDGFRFGHGPARSPIQWPLSFYRCGERGEPGAAQRPAPAAEGAPASAFRDIAGR